MRLNLTEALARRPRWARVLVGVALFAAITGLRFAIGPEFSFSFLYLVPVSFMTWFLSPRSGLYTSLAATGVLLIFDLRHLGLYVGDRVALWDLVMNAGMFLFLIFILGEVRQLYRRERELSQTDPLTGLLNRRAFSDAVESEAQRMLRLPRPLTLVYMDLDNFKPVNDTQGHAAGDRLLQEVARSMTAEIRSIDVAARLGGDEFALLLPETSFEAARGAVAKIHQRLLDAMRRERWPVTFSIGALTFAAPLGSAAEMIRLADQAMYEVKQSGKNRVAFRSFAGEKSASAEELRAG